MHSRGAEGDKRLVQTALHWRDKFILVVSRHAVQNEWGRAQVEWALEYRRPILVARLDEFGWSDMIAAIDSTTPLRHFAPLQSSTAVPTSPSPRRISRWLSTSCWVDFRTGGQCDLSSAEKAKCAEGLLTDTVLTVPGYERT